MLNQQQATAPTSTAQRSNQGGRNEMLQSIARRLQQAQQSQQRFVNSPRGRTMPGGQKPPTGTSQPRNIASDPVSNDSSSRVMGAGMQPLQKQAIVSPNPLAAQSSAPQQSLQGQPPQPLQPQQTGISPQAYGMPVPGMGDMPSPNPIEQAMAMFKAANAMQGMQGQPMGGMPSAMPGGIPGMLPQQQQMHDVIPPNGGAMGQMQQQQTQQAQPFNMTQDPNMLAALQRRMQMGANGA